MKGAAAPDLKEMAPMGNFLPYFFKEGLAKT
jgi:hypothetical protein